MSAEKFWNWIDDRMIIRRICLGISICMTINSYQWVKDYVTTPDPDQLLAAVVVGIPAALQTAMMKFYNEGRNKKKLFKINNIEGQLCLIQL